MWNSKDSFCAIFFLSPSTFVLVAEVFSLGYRTFFLFCFSSKAQKSTWSSIFLQHIIDPWRSSPFSRFGEWQRCIIKWNNLDGYFELDVWMKFVYCQFKILSIWSNLWLLSSIFNIYYEVLNLTLFWNLILNRILKIYRWHMLW